MSDQYAHLRIKEYEHWILQISEYQNYLGRTILWCKREDALDLPDATDKERDELFEILRALEVTYARTFQPDILNYAFLGNETHHLHGHIVPRYREPREFMGIKFVDDRFGKNWLTDKSLIIPEHTRNMLIHVLRESLS